MEFITQINNIDWLYCLFIFAARVADVSLGTLRTIAIVHGRMTMSFWLGFFEAAIWLAVVSTVVQAVIEQPLLGIVYSFGFATGNIVGIRVERLIALGHIILRVISREHPQKIADEIRKKGFRVTVFTGEGQAGNVTELYIVCRRRDLNSLLKTTLAIEPNAFYVTEQAGKVSNVCKPIMQPVASTVSDVCRPIMQPVTGWRAVIKKK